MTQFHLWDDAFEKQIIPVAGDLSRKRLGLSSDLYEDLATKVDLIFHCASDSELCFALQPTLPIECAWHPRDDSIPCPSITSNTRPVHLYIDCVTIPLHVENGDRKRIFDQSKNGLCAEQVGCRETHLQC